MGFYLGGKHEKAIDRMLEFFQDYLDKMKLAKISKMHVTYFTLKFTMLYVLAENPDWRDVLEEVKNEIKMNETEFNDSLEKILNKFREKIIDKIKKGELV